MNLSELMFAIQKVLVAQSNQELAAVLAENPALLEQETLETLIAIAQQAKHDGEDEVAEALQTMIVRIASFAMSQIESAESQSSQPMLNIEPKIAWAIKARRYLALQKRELLTEAIAEARGQTEIVSFLEAFAEGNIPEVDRLIEQLTPILQQTERREEALTLNLLYLHIRAGFAESYFRLPFEQQKQAREMGIQACQQAIQITQMLDDKPCQAIYSGILATCFAKSRQLREAEHFNIEALYLFRGLSKQEPDIFNQHVARTLINLGPVQRQMRKLTDAEMSYAEALSLYRNLAKREPDVFNPGLALTLNNLGNLQWEMRKLTDAEKFLVEALHLYRNLPEDESNAFNPDLSRTLNNLGNVQVDMRKLTDAEKTYAEALQIRRELAKREPDIFNPDLGLTLNNLGNVQVDMRKLTDAEKSYAEALQIRRELAKREPDIFNLDLALTLNNLGIVQWEMQRSTDAEKSFAEALQIHQELANQEPDIFNLDLARTLNNLGAVQVNMRKLTDAEKSFAEALQIRRELVKREPDIFNLDLASTLNGLGAVQWEMRRSTDAEKSFAEALHIYQELANQEPDIFNQNVAMTLSNLGYIQLEQEKLDEAKKNFETAKNLIEDLRAKAITIDDRNRILQENVRVYNDLLACYIRMKDWEKALEIAELSKSRSLSDLLNLKSEDLQPKAPTPDTLGKQYSELFKELLQIGGHEKSLSEQSRRYEIDIKQIENDNDSDDTRQDFLRHIAEEKQFLEQEKRKVQSQRFAKDAELKSVLEKISKYDQDFPPKAKDINAESIFEISKNLNRTIVMFRILRESTAVIFVFPTGGEPHIEEIKGFGQNEMFELFRDKWLIPYLQWKNKEVGLGVWRNAMEQTLDTVYEKLMIHVRQVLKEKSDGKEVLFVPNQSLALLPLHAASWKDEAGRKHYLLEEYTISYAPSVSVFKRCQENEKQRSNKTLFVTNPTGDLDSSEKEVSFIEGLHQPSKNLLRKDATKSAVIEALREDYGFTHFSCHGFYNQANPFESGLVMSDEVIKLSEIINSNLQSNWLTTLSACETGMVDFGSPTDEHFGLPLGFIFAGSPSVWASLWSVSDDATSDLMQMAYENLSKEEYKNNKPEALRQAQLSMLDDRDSLHPFFWAGFQHFGI